jgi:hypothetical protein
MNGSIYIGTLYERFNKRFPKRFNKRFNNG